MIVDNGTREGLDKFLKAASSEPETVLHYEFMQDYKVRIFSSYLCFYKFAENTTCIVGKGLVVVAFQCSWEFESWLQHWIWKKKKKTPTGKAEIFANLLSCEHLSCSWILNLPTDHLCGSTHFLLLLSLNSLSLAHLSVSACGSCSKNLKVLFMLLLCRDVVANIVFTLKVLKLGF